MQLTINLYFGTSQSFQPKSHDDWRNWNSMITPLLEKGYWVTLDFGVEYANDIHEEGWTDFNTFIPMISVKLPYIRLYNYNTTLKIDDTTWGHSNPGVWCHPLNTLLERNTPIGKIISVIHLLKMNEQDAEQWMKQVLNVLEEINFKLMVLNKNLLAEPKKEEENASAKVDLC